MDATRLIVVRHGETAWNVDTRIQGHTDIALNDTGQWQAARVGEALAGEAVRAVYSSDLQRARHTAQAIASSLRVEPRPGVREHRGLRERGFGHFEGLTFAEIEARWPDDAKAWRTRDPHWTPQGGESLLQVRERALQTVSLIAQQHAGDLIVLVSHGGLLDAIYRLATGQDVQAPRTWALRNAAINRLLWTPQGLSLVGWDDGAHLEISRDESTA